LFFLRSARKAINRVSSFGPQPREHNGIKIIFTNCLPSHKKSRFPIVSASFNQQFLDQISDFTRN
jgi:hypothetical protein